jgi:hypothetical protein
MASHVITPQYDNNARRQTNSATLIALSIVVFIVAIFLLTPLDLDDIPALSPERSSSPDWIPTTTVDVPVNQSRTDPSRSTEQFKPANVTCFKVSRKSNLDVGCHVG